jgi:methylglutaconyl-CoA hydratase
MYLFEISFCCIGFSMALIKVMVYQSLGTIVLNRPEKRNALNRELLGELDQAFHDLHLEKKVRAVALTGTDPAFCAGMDLAEMLATQDEPDAFARWYDDATLYRDLLEKMLLFPKPLIAAVNGPALAGGLGLVLACDIVFASAEAKFGLPEPKRGLVAGIVSPLLAFRIGAGQAAPLLLTGRVIESEAAARLGLVHEQVEHDKLWARSVQLADEISQSAPEALLLTKRMLNETIGENLSVLLSAGAATSATARTTECATEGLKAFLEKRDPVWK